MYQELGEKLYQYVMKSSQNTLSIIIIFSLFIDKETDTEKLGNLPNVTQILNGRASSGKFGSEACILSTAISAGLRWSWALCWANLNVHPGWVTVAKLLQ